MIITSAAKRQQIQYNVGHRLSEPNIFSDRVGMVTFSQKTATEQLLMQFFVDLKPAFLKVNLLDSKIALNILFLNYFLS